MIENNYIIIIKPICQSPPDHTHPSSVPSVSIATGSPPPAGGGGEGVCDAEESRASCYSRWARLNGQVELVQLVFCCSTRSTGVLLLYSLNLCSAVEPVQLVFCSCYWFTAVQLCPAWLVELLDERVELMLIWSNWCSVVELVHIFRWWSGWLVHSLHYQLINQCII